MQRKHSTLLFVLKTAMVSLDPKENQGLLGFEHKFVMYFAL